MRLTLYVATPRCRAAYSCSLRQRAGSGCSTLSRWDPSPTVLPAALLQPVRRRCRMRRVARAKAYIENRAALEELTHQAVAHGAFAIALLVIVAPRVAIPARENDLADHVPMRALDSSQAAGRGWPVELRGPRR